MGVCNVRIRKAKLVYQMYGRVWEEVGKDVWSVDDGIRVCRGGWPCVCLCLWLGACLPPATFQPPRSGSHFLPRITGRSGTDLTKVSEPQGGHRAHSRPPPQAFGSAPPHHSRRDTQASHTPVPLASQLQQRRKTQARRPCELRIDLNADRSWQQ